MPLHDPLPNEPLEERLREANPKLDATPAPPEDRDADRAARLPATQENPSPRVGSDLGAASGVETMGTQGEPPPEPPGAEPDALRASDAHESGPWGHPSPVPHAGGPTHAATGFARNPREVLAETGEGDAGGQGMVGAGQGSGTSPQSGTGGDQSPAATEWSSSNVDYDPAKGHDPAASSAT